MTDSSLLPAMREPIPTDVEARILRFARDLALGVLHQLWSNRFVPRNQSDSLWQWGSQPSFREYMQQVWYTDDGSNAPTPEVMVLARLMEAEKTNNVSAQYFLTPNAYDLLGSAATHVITPFISYKRSSSSAIAMMIWSYLQRYAIDPFLDIHAIVLGDTWEDVLKAHLQSSTSLIAVITHETLSSEYVQYELDWALNNNKRIIPVLHGGYTPDDLRREKERLLDFQTRVMLHPEQSAQLLGVLQDLRSSLGLLGRGIYQNG